MPAVPVLRHVVLHMFHAALDHCAKSKLNTGKCAAAECAMIRCAEQLSALAPLKTLCQLPAANIRLVVRPHVG
jgi:hypothetical protein